MEIFTNSAEQTKKVAFDLAKTLKGGEVLALYGDLGSGKTTFVQGLAEGFGIKDRVTSPTFVFVRFYGKNPKIAHIDLYRIGSVAEWENLGLRDFIGNEGIVSVIEWPERIEGHLPDKIMKIKFKFISEDVRKISADL